jgi:hypothetical protein
MISRRSGHVEPCYLISGSGTVACRTVVVARAGERLGRGGDHIQPATAG